MTRLSERKGGHGALVSTGCVASRALAQAKSDGCMTSAVTCSCGVTNILLVTHLERDLQPLPTEATLVS